ncbi:hypothetical protein K5X82_10660 [Halosquirtibacter xylanolyticus]|uniref:chondroitinase-B domain-containing protein n=1 Tax=Halosquirtibacter xylanolyticus TaxID=3374599 RepID=UPI00374918C2|nr:hypothetical protein K5X82_10660 [Prolixibacteraceae bacterium]
MMKKLSLILMFAVTLFGCQNSLDTSLGSKYPMTTGGMAITSDALSTIVSLKTTTVSSVADATVAINAATAGERIVLSPGVYNDLKMVVKASGTTTNPIIIESEIPGKAIISGDCAVELHGENIVLKGFYFKNGARTGTKWKVKGPGLIAIYGSYNRVTECVVDDFNDVSSAYLTTSLTPAGVVPVHCRIDHCSFTNKTSRDQVINLNNTPKRIDTGAPGVPMYHRIDHCYFENPYKKKGNAGGGIRIGFWRKDFGRCLVDSNMFVKQNSEPEIITSKSRENIYYANTFIDCDGTMNLRHGDDQVLLQNFFLSYSTTEQAGGAFIWGSGHLIAGNYFQLKKTMKDRGYAALYLNSGARETTHALAYNIDIANNYFGNNNGYAVDLQAFKSRRIPWCVKNGETYEDPHDLRFAGNIFLQKSYTYNFFQTDAPTSSFGTFNNDFVYGTTALGITNRAGLTVSASTLNKDTSKGIFAIPAGYVPSTVSYSNITGIDLDLSALASQGVVGRPLKKKDTGATWL